MQEMAIRFARNAGVEPDLKQWPGLARAPLRAADRRLGGPDSLPGVAWDVMTVAARLGAMPTPVLSDEERDKIAALVEAGRRELAWLAANAVRSEETERKGAQRRGARRACRAPICAAKASCPQAPDRLAASDPASA